jgi:hypothetical protein
MRHPFPSVAHPAESVSGVPPLRKSLQSFGAPSPLPLFLESLVCQSFSNKPLTFLQDLFLFLNLAPFASINSLFQRLVLRRVNGTMSIG